MFGENAFSLDAFDQDSWLFLLETPYADLSFNKRVFVRAALESAYSLSVADQIISVAARNNLTVIDAMQSINVRVEPARAFIQQARKVVAKDQPRARLAERRSAKVKPIYSTGIAAAIFSRQRDTTLTAEHFHDAIYATSQAAQEFIASAGKEGV